MNLFQGIKADKKKAGAISNTAWVFAEKGVRMVVGFLVTAWVARYLGVRDFGLLSYCSALVGLLAFLPPLGLDAIVRRDLLLRPADQASLLATSARLRLAAALLTVALLLAMTLAGNPADERERWLLVILGFTLFQPVLFMPELYFQANGMARYATWAQSAAVLTAAVLRLLLIWGGAALVWFGVAVVFETVLAWLILGWFARRQQVSWWVGRYSASEARRLLGESWPLLVAGAAVLIYMKIDLVMLRLMAGEEEAGIYSAAVRISEAVYFVPAALVMGLLPYWTAARAAGGEAYRGHLQRIYDLQALAAYAFAVPVTLAAPGIIGVVFGAEYVRAAPVLALHVWAGLFVFSGMVRSQEWVFDNLNQLTLWTTLAGALCNVGLNFWLIPTLGALGAAGATVVSYALAAWGTSFFSPRTREGAFMQTRALLLPLTGWRYLLRR